MNVSLRNTFLFILFLAIGLTGYAHEPTRNNFKNESSSTTTRLFSIKNNNYEVAIAPSETVTGGNDTTICSLQFQLQGSNTIAGTWDWIESSGQASFDPNNTDATPIVTVPTYGLYTFFWTFTDINACVAIGQVDVDFREQPVAQSTDSLFFCQLLDNALEAIPANGGNSGMWSIPSGSFNYNPILANSPLQNNGSFGNYEAIWTVSNSPFCTDSDTTQLIYFPPEQADIQGFDIQVCGYSESITALNTIGSWSSPDPELSFMDPNSPTTIVTTSGAGAYSFVWTVGSGDCATSDSRTILFHDPAEVTITTTTSVACSSSSINLDATSTNGTGVEWSSNGDGVFSTMTDLSTSYSPGVNDSINGTVTLTITNFGTGTCVDAIDQLSIDIIPAVEVYTPSFGSPICSSSSISINASATNAGSVSWNTSGDGVFSPNNTSTLVAYTPGVNDGINGSVVLTLTGFPQSLVCPVESVSTTITLVQPPEAGSDFDLTLCATGSEIDLVDELDPTADTGGVFSDLDGSGALNASMFDPAIAGVGSFDVGYTVTGTSPCSDDMSSVTIEVIAGPNAGTDGSNSLCIQSPNADLSTYLSIDAAAGGSWAPHPFLTGSIFDQGAAGIGDYSFYYIVAGNGPCEPDSAQIQLEITAGPSAGGDASITECTTSTAIDLFNQLDGNPATGGTWYDISGSGAINNGILDATVAGAGEFIFDYVVTLVGCESDTSSLVILILEEPFVEIISFPAFICSIDTIFLEAQSSNTNSISWISSGDGEFGNTDQLLNYYVPGPVEIENVIVDITLVGSGDSSCIDGLDAASISINENPVSDAGPDGSTCGLDYIFPANPSVGTGIWSGPPGIVYSSDPNAPFTVPSSGIYTFTWTEFNQGCVDSDEVTIEFFSSPIISSYDEECINTNIEFVVVIQLEGGDPASYEFSMAGNLIGTEFTTDPIPTGSPFSIAVWDANQCDTFLLEGNFTCPVLTDPGSFDISPLNYCEGDDIEAPFNNDEFLDADDALLFILHDESPGIGTILSTSTSPDFSFIPGMQLDVTYYVSSVAGNDIGGGLIDFNDPATLYSSPVPITFYSPPSLTVLTAPLAFCPGDSALIEVSLSGLPSFSFTYSSGGIEEQVSSESMTASFYVLEAGQLDFLSLEDDYCSTMVDTSLNITELALPSAFIADSAFACGNDIQEIEVLLEGEGPWSYSYFYEGELFLTQTSSSSTAQFLPIDSGTYILTDLTDSNCQSLDSVSMEMVITNSPIADAGPDLVICAGETVTIGGESQLNTTYSWSNPSSLTNPDQSETALLPAPLIDDVQIVDFTITAEFMGCFSEDATQVVINPIPLIYGINSVADLCLGDSTALEAFGGSAFAWTDDGSIEDPSNGNTLVYPTQDVTYLVEISNIYGCSVSDSIFIVVHEPLIPIVTALVPDPCPPAQVLWVNQTIGEISVCEWTFAEGNVISEDCSIAELEYLNAGLHSGIISVTSIYGCQSIATTDTVQIFSGEANFSFSPSTLSIDDSLLHVFDISEDAATQLWTLNGDTAGMGAIASLPLDGLRPDYYEVCLIMTTNNLCVDTTCYEFELDNPVSVYVPNTFTPDGNGLNDEFRAVVHGWDYVKYFNLSVYDRRGHVIFTSKDPNEGWDGINRRDKTIAQGLYEWVVDIDVFGEAYPRRYLGTITVIK